MLKAVLPSTVRKLLDLYVTCCLQNCWECQADFFSSLPLQKQSQHHVNLHETRPDTIVDIAQQISYTPCLHRELQLHHLCKKSVTIFSAHCLFNSIIKSSNTECKSSQSHQYTSSYSATWIWYSSVPDTPVSLQLHSYLFTYLLQQTTWSNYAVFLKSLQVIPFFNNKEKLHLYGFSLNSMQE